MATDIHDEEKGDQNKNEDQANWFAYVGQIKVQEKVGIHVEAQFRLDDNLNYSRQNLFRIGGVYHVNSKLNLALGYGLINTYSPTFDDYFGENRIWQQLIYNHNWKENKNLMNHRFRVEQRFVDRLGMVNQNTEVVATNYQNRFRYLNRNLIHLTDFKNSNNTVEMALMPDSKTAEPAALSHKVRRSSKISRFGLLMRL